MPATGAYLGAWVNPAHQSSGSRAQRAQVEQLATVSGIRPAVLTVYTKFGSRPPLTQLRAIEQAGAMPLISWGCTSTAAITSGRDDAEIRAYAESLKADGSPMFLRWFWEMNLRSSAHAACLGSGGATGFIAAWDHLRAVFASVGATNVAFVWCPGISSGLTRLAEYYPGAGAVDWIGVDGYAHGDVNDVAVVFANWYARYAGAGRPLMIGETGAEPAAQQAYLASLGSELPVRFPRVKAVVYFDAPGPEGNWQLTAAGQAAFGQLAHGQYFISAQ